MIDHLQKYYIGKSQSSRQNVKNTLENPSDFNILKTSRRLDKSAKHSTIPVDDMKTTSKRVSHRKKSQQVDKTPLGLYDKNTPSKQSQAPTSFLPRNRSEADNSESVILQQLSPRSAAILYDEKFSPFNNSQPRPRKEQDVGRVMSQDGDTSLPIIPLRQQKTQKQKGIPIASQTLDSPINQHFEHLAKRYGLKPSKLRDDGLPDVGPQTSKNLVKRLPPAVQFVEKPNQNNQSKQQKERNASKMKAQKFAAAVASMKNGQSVLTPDLVQTTAFLNKYDSEEQLLFQDHIKQRHNINDPPYPKDYGRMTGGSVPAKLENFSKAAHIYNVDSKLVSSKRGSKSVIKNHTDLKQNQIMIDPAMRQKHGSFLSQKKQQQAQWENQRQQLSKHNSKLSVIDTRSKDGVGHGQLVVATQDYVLSQDWLINAEVPLPSSKGRTSGTDAPKDSTQYDSQAFGELTALDDVRKVKMLQPPIIEALPSVHQDSDFKASASSFKGQSQNSGISGIVIPRKFKQLIPPPAYNSLAGSKSSKVPNAGNLVNKQDYHYPQNASESRKQAKMNTKKGPMNIYLSQPNSREVKANNPAKQASHDPNASHLDKQLMNRRLHLQQKLQKNAFPENGYAGKKSFQPIQTNSQKLKQSCYSRDDSSNGRSFPNHIAEAPKPSRATGEQSPYAEDFDKERAVRTLDQHHEEQNGVKLPNLQGNSTFSNEMSQIAIKRSVLVSHPDSARSGSSETHQRSKVSGVYSHTFSRKSNNFRSTHSKAFESRTLIQPNYQPVLHEMRMKEQQQHSRMSMQKRSSTMSRESLNLRSNNQGQTFDAVSMSSQEVKSPINISQVKRKKKHAAQNDSTGDKNLASLQDSNQKNMKSELTNKDQQARRAKVQTMMKRSTEPKVEKLLIKKENIKTPFETPGSSQDISASIQANVTERHKQLANGTNNAVRKSLRSLHPDPDLSPRQTQESSEERVILYDNLSSQDVVKSSDRIKTKQTVLIKNSRSRLPARNADLNMKEMEKGKEQIRLLTEQDVEQNCYVSIDASRDRQSQDPTINVNQSIGSSKQKRNGAQQNAIAIYSQQLTTSKHVSRATREVIRDSSQQKLNNADLQQLISEPYNSVASRESMQHQKTLQAESSTGAISRSKQVAMQAKTGPKARAPIPIHSGEDTPAQSYNREEVLQDLLQKAYNTKSNKIKKVQAQQQSVHEKVAPWNRPKVDLLKPVRGDQGSQSPKHATVNNKFIGARTDLDGSNLQTQDSIGKLTKKQSKKVGLIANLGNGESRSKQLSPLVRDRSFTVVEPLRAQNSASSIKGGQYAQQALRGNNVSQGAIAKPNEVKVIAKKQFLPAGANMPKPQDQTPKTSAVTIQKATRANNTPDRGTSKASKARIFDQQRRKLLIQQVGDKEYKQVAFAGVQAAEPKDTNSKAALEKQMNHQEAKTKGLLKMIDSQASLTKLETAFEQRDVTPPRTGPQSVFNKQARQMAKKSFSQQQQQLKNIRRTSDGGSVMKRYRLEDFTSLGTVGKGSFGLVNLVKHNLSGEIFAMKQIQKEKVQGDKHIQHIKNEKQILKDLTQELSSQTNGEKSFFVNFIETLQDEQNLYLVLEYLPGGELLQQIRQHITLTMDQSLFYLAEVLIAIQQLHQRNIIYRDLKPENILLDRAGHIKLIDFGFSKQLKDIRSDRVRTNCGTPAYAAPEVLIGAGYNYKADIWSFGILICEILGGFTPFGPKAIEIGVAQGAFIDSSPGGGFSSMPPQKMIELVQTGRIILPKNLNPVTRDLVRKILVADPGVRLEIRDIMQHKFFEGIDWNRVARKLEDPPHIPEPVFESQLLAHLQSRQQNDDDSSVPYASMPHFGANSKIGHNSLGTNKQAGGVDSGSGLQPNNQISTLPDKFKLSSKKDSLAKSSPQIKRPNPNSKVLGDFAMNKLNSVFEDF